MLKNKSEAKVLSVFNKFRRYLKVDRIAQLSQISITQILTILDTEKDYKISQIGLNTYQKLGER